MTMLTNLQVLVTRPLPENEGLCQRIRDIGGLAISFPLLSFFPVTQSVVLQQQLLQLDRVHWLIFVSPRAVEFALPMLQALCPILPAHLQYAAIGRATAKALERSGIETVLLPQSIDSSEGLLALPELQASAITGQRIALIKGVGGRQTLATTLAARGADIQEWSVYRRQCMLPSDTTRRIFHLFQSKKVNVVICTSGEILHAFYQLCVHAGEICLAYFLKEVACVVVSERLVSVAKRLGFQRIVLAQGAGNEAIMQSLRESEF